MYSHAVARLWFCSKLRYMEPLNEAMKSLRENIPDKCFLRCSGPERGFCDLLDLTNHKAAEQSTLKKDLFSFLTGYLTTTQMKVTDRLRLFRKGMMASSLKELVQNGKAS